MSELIQSWEEQKKDIDYFTAKIVRQARRKIPDMERIEKNRAIRKLLEDALICS